MVDLVDEVRQSFQHPHDESEGDGDHVHIIHGEGDEMAPGFMAMREFYDRKLLVQVRRGYRHFAGSTAPEDPRDFLMATAEKMAVPVMGLMTQVFAAGVMVGQRSDPLVQRVFQYNAPEHLFHDQDFLVAATKMATGFVGDTEVYEFFTDFVVKGMEHIATLTGFGATGDPALVWDLWLLSGQACICTAYLAGNKLGSAWRERDLLDGIEISLQEDTDGGPLAGG